MLKLDNLAKISAQYAVRRLGDADVAQIYGLLASNSLFYRYCPPPPTPQRVQQDMALLPPGKTAREKYFLGWFDGAALVAVGDVVCGYPDSECAFIGLFMTAVPLQGRGVGSAIVKELLEFLRRQGFARARLCYAGGNPQSEAFWRKNGFLPTGDEKLAEGYTKVVMERSL